MKKTISPSVNRAAFRKLARLLWSHDGQPISRNLDFYREIELKFLTANNSNGGGGSNIFAARIER
jgi:hypothetical protein